MLKTQTVSQKNVTKVAKLPFDFGNYKAFKNFVQLSTYWELKADNLIFLSGGNLSGYRCQVLDIEVKYNMVDLSRIKEEFTIDYSKCFIEDQAKNFGNKYKDKVTLIFGKEFLLTAVSGLVAVCVMIYLMYHNKDVVNFTVLRSEKIDKIGWLIRRNQKAHNLVKKYITKDFFKRKLY